MTRYATSNWPRLLAAALLAWLAQGVVAPATARASCGDYVTFSHGEGQSRPSHHPPAVPRPAPRNLTPCCDQVPNDLLAPGPAPCRGPGCSGNPLPASEPLTTTSQAGGQDHWGHLLL